MQGSNQCNFYCHQGKQCTEKALKGGSLCFWHNPDIDKTGPDIKKRLEERVKKGLSLCGFQLEGAILDGIHLASPHERYGTDLTGINFKRASLYNAHLYQANLTNACLMKADMNKATLNAATLEGCDLLGVSLTGAKLEHVQWGKKLHQEKVLQQLKKEKAATYKIKQTYEEAEEICRHLRRQCESHGLSREAGQFFYKEMRFRRMALPFLSRQRFFSWFFDRLCGYGEKPVRLVGFSLLFIILCAIMYFAIGVSDGLNMAVYQSTSSLGDNLIQFAECLYFSVVTFTTLGYGDITPVGIGRFIAAIEAFIGSFTIALYVVVFVRRMAH